MIVTAKRAGWNEVLTPEEEFDHEPYDYLTDDLQGELVEFEVPETQYHRTIRVCLVGGHEADPDTVTPRSALNVFCPTGKGGGIDPTCSPGGKRSSAPLGLRETKGMSKEGAKEFSKLHKERGELNKKIKAGTASDAEKSRVQEITSKLNEIKDREAKAGGATTPPPSPPPPSPPPAPPPPPEQPKPPEPPKAPKQPKSPKQPKEPASGPDAEKKQLRDQIVQLAQNALIYGSQKLDPGQGDEYKKAFEEAVDAMPVEALKKLKAGLNSVRFVKDLNAMQAEFKAAGGRTGRLTRVLAFYSPGLGRTVLDGPGSGPADFLSGETVKSGRPKIVDTHIRGIYAHELTHAIDRHEKISGTKEWRDAWQAEIVTLGKGGGARLSEYARTQSVEGFAEFGRLLYGEKEASKKAIKTNFPGCWKVFKDRGLVED